MTKQCCGVESVYVDNVPRKEYWYCRQCKKEVLDFTENKCDSANIVLPNATHTTPFTIGIHPYAVGDKLTDGSLIFEIKTIDIAHGWVILEDNKPTPGYVTSTPNFVLRRYKPV